MHTNTFNFYVDYYDYHNVIINYTVNFTIIMQKSQLRLKIENFAINGNNLPRNIRKGSVHEGNSRLKST